MIKMIVLFLPFFVIIFNSCEAIMFNSKTKHITNPPTTKENSPLSLIGNSTQYHVLNSKQSLNHEYLEDENKKLQQVNNYYAYKIKSLNYTIAEVENKYNHYKMKTSNELDSYKKSISLLESEYEQRLSDLNIKYLLSESSRQMLLKNYQQASQLYQQLYDSGYIEIKNEYCDSLYYSSKQRNRSEYDAIINELTLAITICDHKESKSEYARFTKSIIQSKDNSRRSTNTSSIMYYSYDLLSSHRPTASNQNRSSHQKRTSQTTSTEKGCVILCCDGSVSHSQHRRGTCSHHHGVCNWNYCR